MNWRTIRRVLLVLLILINVVLFAYRQYVDDQLYTVSTDDLETLSKTYAEAGFLLPDDLPRASYPDSQLLLEDEELEDLAEDYFADQGLAMTKTYLADNVVVYTGGTETVTIDRDDSSLTYAEADPDLLYGVSEEDAETLALAEAERWLCEDPVLISRAEGEDGTVYIYCAAWTEERLAFASRIEVTVDHGDVTEISMHRYHISGSTGDANTIYRIDEILLSCLDELGEGEDETLSVYYGYEAVSSRGSYVYCDPAVWVLKEDGSGVMVDWLTSSILEITGS